MLLTGKAQRILMRVPAGWGFEAWRRLKREFEPAVAGRQPGLLPAIPQPDLSTGDFMGRLVDYENQGK
eukprot:8451662-Alexandrium_andersonii.AAC.1